MTKDSICPYCKLAYQGARCKRQSCAMRRYMDNIGQASDIQGAKFYSTDKEVIDTVGVTIEEES